MSAAGAGLATASMGMASAEASARSNARMSMLVDQALEGIEALGGCNEDVGCCWISGGLLCLAAREFNIRRNQLKLFDRYTHSSMSRYGG